MKLYSLLLLLCLTTALAQTKPVVKPTTTTKPATTQTTAAAPKVAKPTPVEEKAMRKIIKDIQAHFNVLNDSSTAEVRKQSTSKFLKESLSTITIAAAMPKIETILWNDLDSTKYTEVAALAYGQKNSEKIYHRFDTTSLVVGNVEYDPWRRISLCEVQATKILSYWKPSSKIVKDSTTGKDSVVAIKVLQPKILQQSIFFKLTTDVNGKVSVKLFFIGEKGKKPNLGELPPLQTWWKGLSPEWKSHLSKNKKMDEYPKEGDLSRLTFVDELDLSKSTFTDFAPIAAFTGIKKLVLNDSKFNDTKILSRMKSLKYLDISRTEVRNLDSIQALKDLEEFYCVRNKIYDISAIKELKKLVKLDLSENEIEDISAVASLEFLKELHLSLNIKIKDLTPIQNLLLLEKLSLRKIDLKDMRYLAKLKSLVYLDLYSAGITDLTPLATMPKLYYIDVSANKFTSLEPLRKLTFVSHLFVNNSSMTSLDPVSNYVYLQELDVSNCPQIKTLAGVQRIDALRKLRAINTGIPQGEIDSFKKSHPKSQVWHY